MNRAELCRILGVGVVFPIRTQNHAPATWIGDRVAGDVDSLSWGNLPVYVRLFWTPPNSREVF